MDLLTIDSIDRWEATLKGAELETWQLLRKTIQGDEDTDTKPINAEMRARVVGMCMDAEMRSAKRAYMVALNVDRERFKARMVVRAGHQAKAAISSLDDALQLMRDVGLLIQEAVKEFEFSVGHTTLNVQHLRQVCSDDTWNAGWWGAAKGEGVSGYDTPSSVRRVAAQVQRAKERLEAHRSTKKSMRAARRRKPSRAKPGQNLPKLPI